MTNRPPNPALQPTPVGRVRVRRVPALGGILPRAARLNAKPLEIFRAEPGVLGEPREHSWPDLVVVVKRKHDIGPALAGKSAVRT